MKEELVDPKRAKEVIRKNAEANSEWPFREEASFLNSLSVILRDEIIDPLALISREKMPDAVIGFLDARNKEVLAYYNTTQDAYGLPDQVIFNTAHYEVKDGKAEYKYPKWTQAEILCHELTHLYFNHLKKIDGVKRPAHGAEFCLKCLEMGLHVVPVHGAHYQVADIDSPFGRVMRSLGIPQPEDVPKVEDPKRDYWRPKREKGRSTLEKWSCGCQNVRVGTKELAAHCDICGNPFVRVETKAQGMLGIT